MRQVHFVLADVSQLFAAVSFIIGKTFFKPFVRLEHWLSQSTGEEIML